MEQKEVIEGNKLIAEFMGGEYERKKDPFSDVYLESWTFLGGQGNWRLLKEPAKHQYFAHQLFYHLDWDWIMPVIKKIAIIVSDKLADNYSDAKARWKPIANELQNCNLENVWYCVVQFIRWHNE